MLCGLWKAAQSHKSGFCNRCGANQVDTRCFLLLLSLCLLFSVLDWRGRSDGSGSIRIWKTCLSIWIGQAIRVGQARLLWLLRSHVSKNGQDSFLVSTAGIKSKKEDNTALAVTITTATVRRDVVCGDRVKESVESGILAVATMSCGRDSKGDHVQFATGLSGSAARSRHALAG